MSEKELKERLIHKIDTKTKPIGALGRLEEVALQVGLIQKTLTPDLRKPVICLFAGDHGIAEDGLVNPYPQDVTWQMVYNFLSGGAAINVFAEQNGMEVMVVDAGVKHDFSPHPRLVRAKIAYGTRNYLNEPAMTEAQVMRALDKGKEIVENLYREGSNVIGFGEMGIGNTSSAALIMSRMLHLPVEECVGSGTGLDKAGVRRKAEILKKVSEKHRVSPDNPVEVLQTFGGFEIAMITGGILKAYERNFVILIDGFIVSAALLIARAVNPRVMQNVIFSHRSGENGHHLMLKHFKVRPLLNLGLRLGEGTGAALAYPLVQASVNFLNRMASFETAGVDKRKQ